MTPINTGRFGKGNPGKPKGATNKVTQSIKQAFKEAFDQRGGVPKLLEWADGNPDAFYGLVARLIPTEMSGPDGGPLTITIVRK